jgi:hypothetical protein
MLAEAAEAVGQLKEQAALAAAAMERLEAPLLRLRRERLILAAAAAEHILQLPLRAGRA